MANYKNIYTMKKQVKQTDDKKLIFQIISIFIVIFAVYCYKLTMINFFLNLTKDIG
jgi:hypothetical protein